MVYEVYYKNRSQNNPSYGVEFFSQEKKALERYSELVNELIGDNQLPVTLPSGETVDIIESSEAYKHVNEGTIPEHMNAIRFDVEIDSTFNPDEDDIEDFRYVNGLIVSPSSCGYAAERDVESVVIRKVEDFMGYSEEYFTKVVDEKTYFMRGREMQSEVEKSIMEDLDFEINQ